jgi:hypothetical protein
MSITVFWPCFETRQPHLQHPHVVDRLSSNFAAERTVIPRGRLEVIHKSVHLRLRDGRVKAGGVLVGTARKLGARELSFHPRPLQGHLVLRRALLPVRVVRRREYRVLLLG